VLGFCLIFLFLPETKQRTLEELDYVFAVPVGTFIKYQFTKAVPYWIKRWVFFRKSAKLEPLYSFESDEVRHARHVKGKGIGNGHERGDSPLGSEKAVAEHEHRRENGSGESQVGPTDTGRVDKI
jgi:hypothetical protein